jgi:hypothetical protein
MVIWSSCSQIIDKKSQKSQYFWKLELEMKTIVKT